MIDRHRCTPGAWRRAAPWLALLACFTSGWLRPPVATAAIDAYQFADPTQEQRFRSLIAELRCPKCQNQNIADSNAPLSHDLRQRVYEMVQAGQGDQEIIAFLVARYGDFITYRPPVKPGTWLLWFGPLLGMGAAAGLLGRRLWRRQPQHAAALTDTERARLAALLAAREERP